MSENTEFNDLELASIHGILSDYYVRDVEIQLSDAEISFDEDSSLGSKAVFWHARNANFMVLKTQEDSFEARFYYTPQEHHGAECGTFSDVSECTHAILKLQAEHEKNH